LCLRAELPHLDVTLIESSEIPVIGVGEATITELVRILHKDLNLDIHDFYKQVQPTWKQGIRFEWGKPGDYHFNVPFDWDSNNLGVLGSLAELGHTRAMTFQSILMDHDRVPVFRHNGKYVSLFHRTPFASAYHLDNQRFVRYLHGAATRAGVGYLDRKIVDAALTADGSEIAHLITSDGEKLSYDLYIDCTGFRSMLLGDKLRSPYHSFSGSLFTDRALVFETPHGGHIKSYTTAKSMASGWTWIIPQVEDDHCGYVFSSTFCTEEEAEREARQVFPKAGPSRIVKFRSGRHAEAWKGNVFAIGNAYAFVEPLESTGIMMIGRMARALCKAFPASKKDTAAKTLLNVNIAKVWDGLRWFLSIHYKFNNKYNTSFWQAARNDTDISGARPLLDAYQSLAPLHFHSKAVKELLKRSVDVAFFGLEAIDCILLGQGVPAKTFARGDDASAWRHRLNVAEAFARRCLPARQALDVMVRYPEHLDELVNGSDSWVNDGIEVFSQ
ncbi:MAG TPA: tryptophan 7-halogenase, partial [Kofleriaceae bacterium]|nr:tryptophan 7-halogenase [Kofleriaceae bacterium]